MDHQETSWTLIESAREGDKRARESFARSYSPALHAYFVARWARSPLRAEVEDAAQEVFIDCLRENGALERSDSSRPFRPYLLGVARIVALRFERRNGRPAVAPLEGHDPEADETRLSVAFDRAFAVELMREATELQRTRAAAAGGLLARRVELLELRFQRGLSVPEIARSWGEDPARVHHMYADARADFRQALREVVRKRSGGLDSDLERECDWMLEVLRRGVV